VEEISSLIDTHDVIFILMDSRESRWLPTLLCAAKNKLALNLALGFDTYLIMRHGVDPAPGTSRLGCYFCNDVVAPQNSLKDRTLDQQCTVTRPGLSPTAAGLAVELMVAILHHKEGAQASADLSIPVSEPTSSAFGLIPHSIRGFITHFNNMLVTGQAYDKCTGCSKLILDEYKSKGFDFLLRVFNEPKYLEDLTGLTQMKEEAEKIEWEMGEDDDF